MNIEYTCLNIRYIRPYRNTYNYHHVVSVSGVILEYRTVPGEAAHVYAVHAVTCKCILRTQS